MLTMFSRVFLLAVRDPSPYGIDSPERSTAQSNNLH